MSPHQVRKGLRWEQDDVQVTFQFGRHTPVSEPCSKANFLPYELPLLTSSSGRASSAVNTSLKMDLLRQALQLAGDPKQTQWVCPLVLLADAVLCGLVVWKVPCRCSAARYVAHDRLLVL